MRLCFIGDPASIHTQRWVRWFAREHDVTVICTTDDEALADLRVCTLPTRTGRSRERLLNSVRAVRSVLSQNLPDVVHAHFINEAGWFAAASAFRPFVITAWGSDVYRAPVESRLAARLNPWAVRRANWVTCDSADQARRLRAWGVKRELVSVINWGVDRHEFNPDVSGVGLRARLSIPLKAPVVLSPRQWLPNSNIATVVAAHARLPTDVYLVLKRLPRFERGHGRSVQTAVAQSPARARIRIVGEIDAQQLPSLYAAADVVVSLCTTDGTPVSVLEAMATGRPVVALANASVSEWLSEPGGRMVSSLSVEEVAGALRCCMSAPRERAAVHNAAIIASRADRDAEMARMARIYARLLTPRQPRKRLREH